MKACSSLPVVILLVFGAVSGGCASAARAEPRYSSEDPVAQQEFDLALSLFQGGAPQQAEEAFSSFIIAHPEDPLRSAAELHLGRIAAGRGNHEEAEFWFERAASSGDEATSDTAKLELGFSLLQAGNPERAQSVLAPLVGRFEGTAAAELYGALAEAADGLGNMPDRIRYLDARCSYGGRRICQSTREQIFRIVESLDETALTVVHETHPHNGDGWVASTGRLGILATLRGDNQRAHALMNLLVRDGAEGSPAGVALREAIEQMERIEWSHVGLLLPLTGRARIVGEQMRAGAELAAADEEDTLRLIVRDSSASSQSEGGIEALLDELVTTQRVTAIIGPVDGANANLAAQRAEELGVPLLALTIRPELPEKGRFVFRPFQSNKADVRGLIEHSMQRMGHKTFAILHPEGSYGRVLRELLELEVGNRGGSVEVVRSYAPSSISFPDVCRELAEHTFDALFIPARSRTVALIAPALASVGLWSTPQDRSVAEQGRALQLLFPATAFSPSLIRQTGRYLQGAVFSSVLWTGDESDDVTHFVEDYRAEHGSIPTAYASQAHDAVEILRSARASATGPTREALRESLLSLTQAETVGRFEGFDEQGEPLSPLRLLLLEGQTFRHVE